MTMTCYAIAAPGSDGKPVKYLPFFGEGWAPGTAFKLQSDPAIAWRFGNEQTAQETADVMNATAGNSPGASRHRNRLQRTTSYRAATPHPAVTTREDQK